MFSYHAAQSNPQAVAAGAGKIFSHNFYIVLNDAEFELHGSKLDRLPLSVKLVIEVLEPGSRLTQKDEMGYECFRFRG